MATSAPTDPDDAEALRARVGAYQDEHVRPREDTTSVRGPGWYEAECDVCGWHTSGYESNVDDWSWEHAASHAAPAAPTEGETP